jgi:murein DD-endopeptidase MepM/ murein hydrolase activator NlpD
MSWLHLDQLVVPVVLAAFMAALSSLLPNSTMPGRDLSPGARSPSTKQGSAPPGQAVGQARSAVAQATPSATAPARRRTATPASAARSRPATDTTVSRSVRVPPLHAPVPGPLSRGFEAPASPYGPGHRGVDLAASAGTEVTAPAPGRVRFAGQVGGAGWVSVEVAPAVTVSVGPLTRIAVRAGDDVGVDTVLGLVASGHGDGLHLGLRVGGTYVDPQPHLVRFDPARLVPLEPAARPDERRRPGQAGSGRPARPRTPRPARERPRPRRRPRSATQPSGGGGVAAPRPAPEARRRSRARGRTP